MIEKSVSRAKLDFAHDGNTHLTSPMNFRCLILDSNQALIT
jgi:hypothetical protein